MKKLSKISILIILLILINSVSIHASSIETGQWKRNNTGWWYQNPDGTYPNNQWSHISQKWYSFNNQGYMRTGWHKEKANWYYLNGSGAMETGWVKVGSNWYYLNASGAMETGWAKVGNDWYYMNSSGEMACNRWVDGIYYVGKNGAMLKNTTTPDGYLVDENGKYINKLDSLPNYNPQGARGEMLDMVNQERNNLGLNSLKWDDKLALVADIKSVDLAKYQYYGHNSPTLGSPFDLMKNQGIKYKAAAENLAWTKKVKVAQSALMASPGHKANILGEYTHIGIGISEHASYGNVYVQMFIRK